MPDPWRKRVELCGGRAVCYLGDCLEILPTLAENSVDAILTDPPYGLEFMGKDWDHGVPGVPFWAAALRVAKPGAMLLAFGGTRTHHRLACGIEDAGWEIRDCIMVGIVQKPCDVPITAPATDAARLWQGWGTALKPAWEPIIVAMKPLDGTFAANAEKWGVAGLNVDGCRVGIFKPAPHGGGMERLNAANQRQGYRPNAYQKDHLTGQRPCGIMADKKGEPSWEEGKSLCNSCARRAAKAAKPTAPAKRECSAPSLAGPTSSERGQSTQGVTGRTGIGCSVGQSRAEPNTDPREGSSLSTSASGKKPTDQSLPGTVSTTRTATDTTTGSRICASCGLAITSPSTVASTEVAPSNLLPVQDKPASIAPAGRWPTNLVHDGSEEVLGLFPQNRPGCSVSSKGQYDSRGVFGGGQINCAYGDTGSASRFFYCAKASRAERGEGNKHLTVKPLALMEWLCRLVSTPTGGLVLDPFMGSCTTGLACMKNGQKFIGIEKDVESFETACERIAKTPVALTGDQAKDAKVKRTAFF